MPSKVLGGANLIRTAATVAKKLSRWLAAKGYVSDEAAKDTVEKTSVAGRDLANPERAAMALYGSIRRLPVHPNDLPVHPNDLPEEDWIEFNHHAIARIEPGALWLHVHVEGRGLVETGPIQVPREATELLVQGWENGCSLARVKGQWHIVELGNIHP